MRQRWGLEKQVDTGGIALKVPQVEGHREIASLVQMIGKLSVLWPTGKYAALDADAITPLLELLCSTSMVKVCLNATKALTMLAEAPEGRTLLQAHVPTFRLLQMHRNEAIKRAAQIAIKVIEWKP